MDRSHGAIWQLGRWRHQTLRILLAFGPAIAQEPQAARRASMGNARTSDVMPAPGYAVGRQALHGATTCGMVAGPFKEAAGAHGVGWLARCMALNA